MYDLTEDGYLSVAFEVPYKEPVFYFSGMRLSGGPGTYNVDFLSPDRGVEALYDGIRDHFPAADIKPGDLATLTSDDDGVFTVFQGRKIQFENWSPFPNPGLFDVTLPGPEGFYFRVKLSETEFVRITATCNNLKQQAGEDATINVVLELSPRHPVGSDDAYFELKDPKDPPFFARYPTLKSFQEALAAKCPYPNPSEEDFKVLSTFSPNTILIQAFASTGELYPLTRSRYFLSPGVYSYTADVAPFATLTYRLEEATRLNIDCSCSGSAVTTSELHVPYPCRRDDGRVFCISKRGITGDFTSEKLALCRQRCLGSRLLEGISFDWFFAPTKDAMYLPFGDTPLRIKRSA
ncbi:hypothetical protein FOL46_008467 [Perkinsus olseni]|uniref:Uncharacterized protein n=1 Tax=Perkinsus olseni TaxID=32597 RepID=A0A7J6MN20_PEROL|nr:hypothetical protein FOL46_008467 [Perkinsus olseni]